MSKTSVFVSYVTVEAKFADLLSKYLKHDFIGLLDPFISSDATSIPVGNEWLEKILEAVARARLMFVICSPHSVLQPWINYETGAARIRNVEIVPLCHSGSIPALLPPPLNMAEGLVLTEAMGLRKMYTRLAEILSSDIPNVAFDTYAAEFRKLQDEYSLQRDTDAAASKRSTSVRIGNPRVLCVTSEQFLELGYKNQLEIVINAFPQNIEHNVVKTLRELEDVLGKSKVDILHIATYVCPRTGLLYFTRVELPSGQPVETDSEVLGPDALAVLVRDAGARLVVIVGGGSLALVTELLAVTNVITPYGMVSAKALANWVQTFYGTLRMKPLAESCEYAAKASQVPMRLLVQQVNVPEIPGTQDA